MAQPESRIVEKIRRALVARGAVVVKIHGSAYTRSGTPDLIGCLPGGRAFALEVKQPGRSDGPAGNGASALQLRELDRWRAAGAVAAVVCSASEALAACDLPVR